MNVSYLEIIIALTSVFSSFYLVLQYLVRFQRKIDRMLIAISIQSKRMEDVEKFLGDFNFNTRTQINEDVLPEIDTDFLWNFIA